MIQLFDNIVPYKKFISGMCIQARSQGGSLGAEEPLSSRSLSYSYSYLIITVRY